MTAERGSEGGGAGQPGAPGAGPGPGPTTCRQILRDAPAAWDAAVRHPFLAACADGTIDQQRFGKWMVQDRYFVIDFTRYVARALAKAPEEHFEVLLLGLESLRQEIVWFKANAKDRGLDVSAPRNRTCRDYCKMLANAMESPYPVHAAQLWAIEMSYNMGWRLPGPMKPPYNEFAERWGSTAFTEYVLALERQADEAMATASKDVQEAAVAACLEVAHQERGFWDMANSAADEA